MSSILASQQSSLDGQARMFGILTWNCSGSNAEVAFCVVKDFCPYRSSRCISHRQLSSCHPLSSGAELLCRKDERHRPALASRLYLGVWGSGEALFKSVVSQSSRVGTQKPLSCTV